MADGERLDAMSDFMPHANVTPQVVDRAVEETFRSAQVSPAVQRVMRSLMAGDSNSPVAKAYYHGVASGAQGLSTLGVARRFVDIPYALPDDQVAALTEYAMDYRLRFSGRELHDHPNAAACRVIDRNVVDAKLPPGVPVSHIGGAALPLITSGRLGNGHHACMPLVDKKDVSRHVLQNLRIRKIASTTDDTTVRKAAMGFLAKEPSFVCNKKVQDCELKTPVLTCVHVYDIPMEDWAGILDKKGGQLVEGCVLFPRELFTRSSGEMKVAGARYELDARADTFRMGFIGSPSWWYEHKLSDYMRYGVDQVLSSGGAVYSYKITERRGDTIFFRILRVAATVLPDYVQHFRVPGVEMVRVNGFPVDKPRSNPLAWARKTYLFPAALWEDMLGHAKEMIERGSLSHEKLFGYYRTVAPRQSINAVVVAGGATVDDLTCLVPLVVHVVLFALLEVKKTRIESQALADSVMRSRVRDEESTFMKVVAAFGDALKASLMLTCAPLSAIAQAVSSAAGGVAQLSSYDWEIVPTMQTVSAKIVLGASCFRTPSANSVVTDFTEEFSRQAPRDMVKAISKNTRLSQFARANFCHLIPADQLATLPGEVSAESTEREQSDVGQAVVEQEAGSVYTADVSQEEVQRRKDAIVEAIVESRSEASKIEASCADHYRELMIAGRPSLDKMVSRREMFFNPAFWKVVGGVIEADHNGKEVASFIHAAVYQPHPVDGTRLVLIEEDEFKGMSRGEYVERTYYRLQDSTFSGWVYTNDSLMIHNGPAVERALMAALEKPLDFHVLLMQGPPGCGKTSQIVAEATPEDVVLVPVRKAAAETRERLQGKEGFTEAGLKLRVKTLDSYLVNFDRTRVLRGLSAQRLMADEAFMAREGRWMAAAALLGVASVQGYGDSEQIPHVPRAECPKNYVKLRPQHVQSSWITYRCPPESVACWGGVYDWKVRSKSPRKGSVKQVASSLGMDIPRGCVMMGMYQADKKLLKQMYANSPVPIQIMTVHESEGNTYEHVWLHRFDLRKRTDGFSLYDKKPYALVAMSRNTHSFLYVSPDVGDLVSQWIKVGQDVRRVAACQDVSSAGRTLEKL